MENLAPIVVDGVEGVFKTGIKEAGGVVLDCRNGYESAVGTFEGAVALDTATYKVYSPRLSLTATHTAA